MACGEGAIGPDDHDQDQGKHQAAGEPMRKLDLSLDLRQAGKDRSSTGRPVRPAAIARNGGTHISPPEDHSKIVEEKPPDKMSEPLTSHRHASSSVLLPIIVPTSARKLRTPC